MHRYIHTYIYIQIDTHKQNLINKLLLCTDGNVERQTDMQTYRHADRHIDRQTYRQTDI